MVQEIISGFLIGIGGLSALFMILRYKLKMREQLPDDRIERILESQDQILSAIEDLRDEVGTQDRRVAELSGRIEFAERLLAQGSERKAPDA